MINVLYGGIFDTSSITTRKMRTKERKVKCFELEYIIDTDGTSIIDDVQYKLFNGSIIFAKPDQKRSSIPSFKCFFVHFTVDKDDKYYNLLMNTPTFFQVINSNNYKHIFHTLFNHLSEKKENTTSDLTYGLMLQLFYLLLADSDKNSNCANISRKKKTYFIFDMTNYLQEHYNEKITLESLSKKYNYSPNYIQCTFKKIIGVSPQKYLLDIRLEKAKSMIIEGSNSLIDITLSCGFASQSYFISCFKKKYRFTPLQFINTMQSNYKV